MNDHKEHITHYSAADIQRYVQGKLSAREMYAMEKAALDDPFLADAMEGMQQALADHDENLVTGQLNQLQQQFQTRTAGTGKVVAFKPFRYWQAVAAAVVVIISGVWIYSLVTNPDGSNTEVVVAQRKQPTPAPVVADTQEMPVSTDSITMQGNTANATTRSTDTYYKNKKEVTASTPVPAAPPAPETPSLARQKTDSLKPNMDDNRGDIASNKKVTAKDVAAEKQEAAPTPAAAVPESLMKARRTEDAKAQERSRETELITIAKSDSPKKSSGYNNNFSNNLSGVIKGQVTDLNNNPVANAYVQIPKNNNNIITDKTGFFKIPVSDSVVDVAVNVTGYGTQNFRLQNNAAMNQLQLQPANAALNKPVVNEVKGKKVALNRSNYPSTMVHDAEPVNGWAAFDQYLEKNKKTISAGIISAGHVVVSFQVNKKGTLSDFKIEQSLSKTYDDEAIRLITEGPAWKLLKGRKARITVMVRF
ncbi:MAG TPA: carboxypeptidase-like regulatory domain-containing protein [Niastella sp.]